MNNEQQETKRPRGRPAGTTKEKKGALIWVQSDFVDSVNAFLETLKQQQQKQQAKTS
jgi:hypothetical protein